MVKLKLENNWDVINRKAKTNLETLPVQQKIGKARQEMRNLARIENNRICTMTKYSYITHKTIWVQAVTFLVLILVIMVAALSVVFFI